MENQEKVWDRIAPEWHEYKKIPSEGSKKFLENASGKVLDLGSGSGRHLTKIENGKMYLLDVSNEMLKLANKKAKEQKITIETIHSSMMKIPIEDEFFDFGISISALHCIEGKKNRKKSVEELYRILKKNSEVYIGVWNFQSKRFNQKKGKEKSVGWRDKGKRYYYLHDEQEIHNLFKSSGFEIVSTHNSEMMINFIARKV
ncbi:MAG: class I SAM-dependent methyltransferase [Nanoarchaeota archaeon]|nr:class I SAM-dependent methyltransferase [Nanoarchaeota archaeon]